ncbi:MAG: UDP-N-acetylglucosamine 2-epimerase (non-hydrolyzing) [Clostridia bacterium]|nr:UDP-N-acetylglucosamine 2-epimerase (non-hydrolyzing) [Clostridia bacterium]
MKRKIKVMLVFGTRPEAIKMAPLIIELKRRKEISTIVCVTAQHRQMLDQVLEIFNINPDYDLDLMQPNQTLTSLTKNAIEGVDKIIKIVNPDLVLVHGDTTTSFAGALASFYNQIKIGHIEAGLRTYNLKSPFPEEANRQFVSTITDMHFAPTMNSKQNLINELKPENKIFVTGNTAIDALKYTITDKYENKFLDWAKDSRLILLTTHRRENLGEPMRNIFKGLKRILQDFNDVKVIYPVHLNPLVRKIANEMLGNEERIKLIEPLNVIDFHNFINKSYLILTDSGGVQEEAPSLGKPVLVLRDTTERPEGVDAGTLKVIGTKEIDVYNETKTLLTNDDLYSSMSKAQNPYGDGNASVRIADIIIKEFNDVPLN